MGNGYPQNPYEMRRAGYALISHRACRDGCGATVERWRTRHGKELDFNPMPHDNAESTPHWVTCAKRKRVTSPAEKSLDSFAASRRAATVLVIDANGNLEYTVALPYPDPADLHTALLNAADTVRDFVTQQLSGGHQ